MTDNTAAVGEWALPAAVVELVAQRPFGVLTTLRRNGRLQQSVVSFAADEHQGRPRIRISVTATAPRRAIPLGTRRSVYWWPAPTSRAGPFSTAPPS